MMNRNTRNALMLLLMLGAAVIASGCGAEKGTQTPAETGAPSGGSTSVTAETEDTLRSSLPEGLDFDGKAIRISNAYCFEGEQNYITAEEQTGDLVFDAVYRRNLAVESLLNADLVYTNYAGAAGSDFVKKSVMAADDAVDLCFDVQWLITPLLLNNAFLNLADTAYLDLEQPWWPKQYINELSVGVGNVFFVAGDISLGTIRYMDCMYANKEVYEQYIGERGDIYSAVLDGTWTLDLFAEQCRQVYRDVNGDNTPDGADVFGTGLLTESICDHFVYDSGIRATARDKENMPYLTLNNERTADFTRKLYSLYYENAGTYVFDNYNGLNGNDIVNFAMPAKFGANELLYLPLWFYTSEYMRETDVDYAVLPFPKYDENQESYLSLVHDIATVVCVPTTCTCADEVSAVMEALAFYGYRDVLPTYYEIAMKVKYSRDSSDSAMKILDMIHDSATTDFAYIYNYALQNAGLIERTLMGKKNADFASYYAKNESRFEKAMVKLLDSFTENR